MESSENGAESTRAIDPDQQCAVRMISPTGGSGGRCRNLLTCRVHSPMMKRAVADRSRPFDELLEGEPAHITGRGNRAAVAFDLDSRCAVIQDDGTACVANLVGDRDLLAAKTAVPGRSAPFEDLVRRLKLASVRTSNIINMDTKCAVKIEDGKLCQRNLICKIHSIGEKTKVQGRSAPFKELLRQYELKGAKTSKGKINLDSNCAVDIGDGELCKKPLTCVLHSLAEQRAVQGRSAPLEELLRRYRLSRQKASDSEITSTLTVPWHWKTALDAGSTPSPAHGGLQ